MGPAVPLAVGCVPVVPGVTTAATGVAVMVATTGAAGGLMGCMVVGDRAVAPGVVMVRLLVMTVLSPVEAVIVPTGGGAAPVLAGLI